MFKGVLLGVVILLGQKPPAATEPKKPVETGVIAGTVLAAGQQTLSQPVQIILLSPRYTELWDTDVQQRLDNYWERYKPAFAMQKEMFLQVARMAQKEAATAIVARMRRDASMKISDYLQETSNGKFEFRNVPFGVYHLLAVGRTGDQELVWQDSVDVHTSFPQFVDFKKSQP